MAVLKIILLVIHITVSLGLIVTVLLHSGKGGGLSGMISGGGGSSMFSGSYVVEKNLDRLTIIMGCLFVITTLLLVWLMT